eukprot:Sdes_comp20581_c0_seq1m15523
MNQLEDSIFPFYVAGPIVKGFGRGSKELGIPTANFSLQVVEESLPKNIQDGVYFGFARLDKKVTDSSPESLSCQRATNQLPETHIYQMVMSIGWNPFYKNLKRSAETHILHDFNGDLYGQRLSIVVVGFIRPQENFSSVEELIAAIHSDIQIAKLELQTPSLSRFCQDPFLSSRAP